MSDDDEVVFTHKGWLGLCPVLIGDLDKEDGILAPRRWILWAWLELMFIIYAGAFVLRGLFDPDFEPAWPLMVTGRVKIDVNS